MRVIQRRDCARLVLKSIRVSGQSFDRDTAAKTRVIRLVHLAHPTGRHKCVDLVRTKAMTGFKPRRASHDVHRRCRGPGLAGPGFVLRHQRREFLIQAGITSTPLAQIRVALGRRAPHRIREDRFDFAPAVHRSKRNGWSNCDTPPFRLRCSSEPAEAVHGCQGAETRVDTCLRSTTCEENSGDRLSGLTGRSKRSRKIWPHFAHVRGKLDGEI
nr:hypothetical protein Hi04_10k_c3826_00028 [uncultured bacterium]